MVEWGEGVAEGLAEDRLEVRIERTLGGLPDGAALDGADPRRVALRPVGTRWTGTVRPAVG